MKRHFTFMIVFLLALSLTTVALAEMTITGTLNGKDCIADLDFYDQNGLTPFTLDYMNSETEYEEDAGYIYAKAKIYWSDDDYRTSAVSGTVSDYVKATIHSPIFTDATKGEGKHEILCCGEWTAETSGDFP